MIGNQIQRASKTGFYWKVWENKWVSTVTQMRSMFVCGGWRKADYYLLRDPDRRQKRDQWLTKLRPTVQKRPVIDEIQADRSKETRA